MPIMKRVKTDYVGVYYIMGTAIGTGKPEKIYYITYRREGKLIEEKATWPQGDIPVDPGGGVVSTNAIGASGMQRMVEAVTQIRGDAGERQVTKKINLALTYAQGADQFATMALLSRTL